MARTWWAHPQQEARAEPRDAADWFRANGVTLTAVALIVIQLWWKGGLLARSYFRQDDYLYLVRAVHNGLSWKYLMWMDSGHMLPAGFAINWVLARMSLYNWALTSALILLLLAAACFAMLAMLRTVFGNRPAILIPLTLFLFSPLSLAAVGWWAVAEEILPFELALCLAIRAHVLYLRDSRLRHALAATGWLIVGMAATDKGALVPFLLLALTAAFFVPRGDAAADQPAPPSPRPGFGPAWLRRLGASTGPLGRYWRAWLLYAAVLGAYCVVYFVQLGTSNTQPGPPTAVGQLAGYIGTLLGSTLPTGVLGGPWRWWSVGYAQAGPPAGLEQLSWLICLVVIVLSCIYRARAWRAWAILLGWLLTADVLPVAVGRLGTEPGSLLGLQTRYLTDAVPVIALCLALAFLPVVGERHPYRLRFRAAAAPAPAGPAPAPGPTPEAAAAGDTAAGASPESGAAPRQIASQVPVLQAAPGAARLVRDAAVLVLAAALAGSFVSMQTLQSVTKFGAARAYIETAQIAVAHAPVGTLIVDGPVPTAIMDAAFFARQADTSQVIGVIAASEPARHLRWISSPHGAIRSLMIFNQQGQLSPVHVGGPSSLPPPQPQPQRHGKHARGQHRSAPVPVNHCWTPTAAGIRVPLDGSLYRWPWTIQLDYSGPATVLAVSYGTGWHTVTLPAGGHSVYVSTVGSGAAIGMRLLSAGPPACITTMTVGSLQPDAAAQAIPPTPASG